MCKKENSQARQASFVRLCKHVTSISKWQWYRAEAQYIWCLPGIYKLSMISCYQQLINAEQKVQSSLMEMSFVLQEFSHKPKHTGGITIFIWEMHKAKSWSYHSKNVSRGKLECLVMNFQSRQDWLSCDHECLWELVMPSVLLSLTYS